MHARMPERQPARACRCGAQQEKTTRHGTRSAAAQQQAAQQRAQEQAANHPNARRTTRRARTTRWPTARRGTEVATTGVGMTQQARAVKGNRHEMQMPCSVKHGRGRDARAAQTEQQRPRPHHDRSAARQGARRHGHGQRGAHGRTASEGAAEGGAMHRCACRTGWKQRKGAAQEEGNLSQRSGRTAARAACRRPDGRRAQAQRPAPSGCCHTGLTLRPGPVLESADGQRQLAAGAARRR
jgi:hypothetical protein